MKSLDRYLFRQLVFGTAAVTVAITFAVWLAQSLRFIDFLVNRGLPVGQFFRLTLLLLPSFMVVALPIAVFVSVLFIMQKAMQDSELVVLRAAGMSPFQIMRPALALGFLVMGLVYGLTTYLQPLSAREFRALQLDVRDNYISVFIQEGVFNTLGDSITLYVRDRDASGGLHGILAHDSRDPEHPSTLVAESGALIRTAEGPRIVLINGIRQEMGKQPGDLSSLQFDRYTLDIRRPDTSSGGFFLEERERYLGELFSPPETNLPEHTIKEFIAEGHGRLSNPLYVIALAMIAAAAMLYGDFNRRGQQKRLAVAIASAGSLMAVQFALQDLVGRNLEAVPIMYLVPLLAIVAVVLLLRRRAAKPPRQLAASAA